MSRPEGAKADAPFVCDFCAATVEAAWKLRDGRHLCADCYDAAEGKLKRSRLAERQRTSARRRAFRGIA